LIIGKNNYILNFGGGVVLRQSKFKVGLASPPPRYVPAMHARMEGIKWQGRPRSRS